MVFGAPLRLVVLESNRLVAGVAKSYTKQQKALEPLIKKPTQPTQGRLCDAKKACTRFRTKSRCGSLNLT